MFMNRTFLLASATVLTLGISVASSTPAYARHCSDANSDREEAACLIRGAIYKAKAAAAMAQQMKQMQQMQKMQQMQQMQQMQAARAQQQAQQAATAPVTKPNAASPPESCLTKEYVNGAVKFRDTCTGEWAQGNYIEPKKAGSRGEVASGF